MGTITRTWTATDCAGNISTCVQTITIKDDTPPTISCPANATFDCTLGDAGSATASDNCTEDLDIQISSSDVNNLDECGLGTITRTWTATDCAGNSSTCVQTITIKDDTPPTISCPANATFDCTLGDAGSATASDNCTEDLDIQISSSDVNNLDECGLGTITRTWTATDCAGNSSTCVQTITIKDDTPPTISCPANATFDCTLGDAGSATASDNCTEDLDIQISSSDVNNLDECGLGTITRTWTATDCAGNSSTCVQIITIKDDTPPSITCEPNKSALCGIVSFDEPTASDNCGSVTVAEVGTIDNRDICGNGTIIRTWIATDCAGNTATCSQTITINDCGDFELLKTTNGAVNASKDWAFTLSYGNVEIDENTLGDGDGILFDQIGPLSASETYTLCETGIPAGYTAVWRIDSDADGVADMIVPAVNPDFPLDLGTRCIQFGAGTSYPLPLGETDIGCTLHVSVDNTFPGGDPRTPGYWKNWSSCSGGNQVITAAKNGGCDEGFCTLDDILNDPGIIWCIGTSDEFIIDDCEQAVDILDARDHNNGKKKSSDAAYTLARALLAAHLNFAAGAEVCQAALDAALAGESLLCSIGFDGTGDYLKGKGAGALKADALCLATALDNYNNGTLCPDGSFNCASSDVSPPINFIGASRDDVTNQVITPAVEMEIYPNPAWRSFYIDINGLNSQDLVVQLVDPLSRLVREEKINYRKNERIEMLIPEVLSDGLYYVRIKHQDDISMKPVIISQER